MKTGFGRKQQPGKVLLGSTWAAAAVLGMFSLVLQL